MERRGADLLNYLGHFLELGVAFGRYHGAQGQTGFGISPTPWHFSDLCLN